MIKSPNFFFPLSRKQNFRTMDLWEAQSCTFGICWFSCLSCRSRAVWSLFSFLQVLSCLWLRICSIVMETKTIHWTFAEKNNFPGYSFREHLLKLFKKLLGSACFGFSLLLKLSVLNRKLLWFCCCWIFLWTVCCVGVSVSCWWCSGVVLMIVSEGWWEGIECDIVVGWPPCCLVLCLVWMPWFSISVPSIETEACRSVILGFNLGKTEIMSWRRKLEVVVMSVHLWLCGYHELLRMNFQ